VVGQDSNEIHFRVKMSTQMDLMTRERDELTNWIVASIDSLQVQMDNFKSELELITADNKMRLDKEKQDRIDDLKVYLEKHKFHMIKLETLMRMLNNLAAEPNAFSSTTVSFSLLTNSFL
jgi:CCR4-NOT transcription complex subunit 3